MRSRAVITASLLGTALFSGGWLMQRGLLERDGGGAYDGARLFDQVAAHVARYYVDTVSLGSLYQKAADGLLLELGDPHSTLLTPERLARLQESTSGRYAGVGFQIDVRDGWITVVAPLPGTPAAEAGIQTGDRVVQIDGKSTRGWTGEEATKALRGEAGSRVVLTIERPGVAATIPFRITRREIHFHVVRHATMLRDDVGYVDLTTFGEESADELRQAIDSLRQRGMRTLVFDLRGDPGGLLDQGVAVSDLFLDRGKRIVSMRGRTRDANREYADRAPQPWTDMPLVVLVDSGSASAAEIVAGALQDHDRAVLVGTTTYGKGSAQSLFPTANGGALKLTTALWYTPSGRSINRPHRSEDEEDDAPVALPDTAPRPRFRTDAGRTVLGGGGITPDVVVSDSSARTVAERAFEQALGKQVPQFRDALTDYALSLKGERAVASPSFAVTPAMREALWTRLVARGVKVPRETYDAAGSLIDRMLGYQIARYVFGEQAEFARVIRDDATIAIALQLAAGARSQRDLLDRAARVQSRK